MVAAHVKFSQRLKVACDDAKLPAYGRPAKVVALLAEGGVKISVQAVRKWFDGETLPSMENLSVLAGKISIDANYLLTGIEPTTPQPQLSADEHTLLAIYRGLSPAARANAITEMEVLQVRDKRAGAAAPERQPAPPKDPPSDLCRDRRAQ